MKKSLLYSLAILILTLPETLATEPVLFKDFEQLPLDIQVKIFSESDHPAKALSVSKRIRTGMRNRYLWAKSDEGLTSFVDEAYDETAQFMPDARIMKALDDSSGLILLKRLVLMPGNAETKTRVRNIIVRHIVRDLFFSKDTLIEISRKYPDLTKSVLRLARGEFTHRCPLIYADQLPKAVAALF